MVTNVIFTFVLILSWLFSLSCQAEATFRIDKVVSFGDSLTDNGNLYRHTQIYHNVNPNMQVIPKQPYFEGRFCNGPVWVEYLVKLLKLNTEDKQQFSDQAYGGSWVEPYEVSKHIFPPYLEKQVDAYLENAGDDHNFENHLFTLWHGANDILIDRDNDEAATTSIIQLMRGQIERLIALGGKHFVLINMPDLGIVPINIQIRPDHAAGQTEISQRYNQKLVMMVNEVREEYGVDIVIVDVFTALHTIVEERNYHGRVFKKVNMPCYKGRAGLVHVNDSKTKGPNSSFIEHVCRKPDEYVFWDWIHPSTRINELIAEDAFEQLKNHGLEIPAAA